jgi:hypothetical protein
LLLLNNYVIKMEKRKMELLALVLPIFLLFFVQGVFSLQEVAGPLVISVPVGGINSAQWGLLNDGNQAITTSLSATGNAAQYLSFPQTVVLQPGIIDYVSITATIPATYSGGNITGYLTATQAGQPGQVQINVQMIKSLTITVTGQSTTTTAPSGVSFVNAGGTIYVPTTTTTSSPPTTTTVPTTTASTTTVPTSTTSTTSTTTAPATNPIAGLITSLIVLQPIYYVAAAVLAAMIIVGLFFLFRNREENEKTSVQDRLE